MSLPSDERLMQLHDGELGPDEAAELERRIAEDPDVAAVLRGLEQVGNALREAAEADGAKADDIASRVMARIEAEASSPAPGGDGRGVLVTGRWRHAVPVAAGVLALAAAALLVARWGAPAHQPVVNGAARSSAQAMRPRHVDKPARPAATKPAPEAAAADSTPPVAIETVDFGSHDGAIFMVSAGEESTPVVWLTDEPAAAGGRTKPL